jgi:hypothetical protein
VRATRALAVLVLVAIAPFSVARSAEWQSSYQDLSARICLDRNPEPAGRRADHAAAVRACPAFLGYRIEVIEHPHRHELRITPPERGSAAASLVFLSGLGPRAEWRGPKSKAAILPRALIVRVGAADLGDEKSALLAIMKISPQANCLIGVVDVRTNPDANAVARREADSLAEGFSCGSPSKVLGQTSPFAEAFIEQQR